MSIKGLNTEGKMAKIGTATTNKCNKTKAVISKIDLNSLSGEEREHVEALIEEYAHMFHL
ncbi:hypothetical protein DD595_25425 [Enterobacter cloacae complex sp. 4DZ3-17B2]|nr:hypothetical protein DD595_25425 [Enterobacter cloacae complex sp. 4DZ3-17B2]